MTKLKDQAVGTAELEEFLRDRSDFAFELSILHEVLGTGLVCEHAGSYDDPVTKKPRQFDIRAQWNADAMRFLLAIECKNLRPSCPLLVSCVPRRESESYHEVLYARRPNMGFSVGIKSIPLSLEDSIYWVGAPVGKSTAQVGRQKDGDLYWSDQEVYDKWAQAVSSASDLVRIAHELPNRQDYCSSIVLPVLVVPNATLWNVVYDPTGKPTQGPAQTDRCTLFLDKEVNPRILHGASYRISHLEVVTRNGLCELLAAVRSNLASFEFQGRPILPEGRIVALARAPRA